MVLYSGLWNSGGFRDNNDGGNEGQAANYGTLPRQKQLESTRKTQSFIEDQQRKQFPERLSTNGEESTNPTESSEVDLPSLTAAFQRIENRPILLNCLYYLAIYFAVAVVAYSFVFERWSIIDSLYFATNTL